MLWLRSCVLGIDHLINKNTRLTILAHFTSCCQSFRAFLIKSATPEIQDIESKLHVPSVARPEATRAAVRLFRAREELRSEPQTSPLPVNLSQATPPSPLHPYHPITPPTCSRSTPSPPRDAIEPFTDDCPPTAVLPGPSAPRRSARLPRPSGLSPPPSSASPAPPLPARMEESTRSLVPSSTVCPSPSQQRRHLQLCARREKQPTNVCAQSSLTPRRSLPF